jgi:hypothetical protein
MQQQATEQTISSVWLELSGAQHYQAVLIGALCSLTMAAAVILRCSDPCKNVLQAAENALGRSIEGWASSLLGQCPDDLRSSDYLKLATVVI